MKNILVTGCCGFIGMHLCESLLEDRVSIIGLDNVNDYYEREVKPHIPDSWMDRSKDKIGYEINFTKYFYKFTPLRSLEDISQDLKSLDDEIKRLSMGMTDE